MARGLTGPEGSWAQVLLQSELLLRLKQERGLHWKKKKMSASSCLLLLKSKWAVMRSSFSPWCTCLVWICGCSFAECSLCCSAQYYPPHSLTAPCTCMLSCQRALKNGLKAVAAQNPTISTMGGKKPMGIFISSRPSWVWQEKKDMAVRWGQDEQVCLGPQEDTEV